MARSHVKFAVDTNMDSGHIHLEEREGVTEAHIGLLKCHHTYSAEIPVTHSLGSDITALQPQHNIYVRVADVSQTTTLQGSPQGQFSTTVTVHVNTIKEGSIGETVELASTANPSSPLIILITAKVLLGNQGNPMLKDGVHLISHEHHDDSDCTEWPGHGQDSD